MSKHLVILESPNKVKKVQAYLGKDYDVVATKGHIRDLPERKIGVDIRKNFTPTYEIYPEKTSLVNNIVSKAKKSDSVYLMTDPDREGDYIAFHVLSQLPKSVKVKRAKTGSITKAAVQKAISESGDLDMNMVDSAETRRILDRIVGYKASFPTKQATGGASAGRVQSAALRIISEREKEIRNFVPQEYWPIEATLEKENGERVVAKIKVPDRLDISNEKLAKDICADLEKNEITVSKYSVKEFSVKPYAPFTTSSMYQSASSFLGWGTDRTPRVAQALYEKSLCTYIRSDSVYMVPEAINAIRDEINTCYGCSYLPSSANIYSNKKGSQEGHEAIRPTDPHLQVTETGDERKLYQMMWKRAIASQMKNMIQERVSAEFVCKNYVLSASGSKVVFDGWRKVWDYGSTKDEKLPEFTVGEKLKLIDIKTEQKFTEPPSRYTESSIIKQLEDLGIGRPSTYASILSVLFNRGYVVKEKKSLEATDMGIRVSDFLIEAKFCFIDLSFTKNMEEQLDCIAEGKCQKVDILKNFWERLKGDLEYAKQKRFDDSKSDYKCPDCGGFLLKKFSKYGPFYTCENRTNKENPCDYKCQMNEDESPKEKEAAPELSESDICCPNCGEKFIIRISKKGNEYLSCRNWRDDKCKGFYTMEGEKMEFKKKKKTWKKNKKND